MSDYTRDELLDLAASYAIGSASPEEANVVEQAMRESPELANEVAGFREVADLLAQSRAAVPSPAIRERLLERARASKQTRPRRLVASSPRRLVAWTAMAASFLLAAVLVVQNIKLGSKLNHREHTLNSLLEAEKDLHVVHLKAADTITGPGIQFFWNEKQRMGVAHAFRMPPAPDGRTYQLWIMRDGQPVSVKVFNSDADGHALVEGLDLPPSSKGVTQVLLTVEPAGGSPKPTTDPILRGEMATH